MTTSADRSKSIRDPLWIILTAAAVHLAMIAREKSFWGDEWMDIRLALGPFSEAFWGSVHDVHPPFFFLLLNRVVRVLGQADWVFRSVSLVSGVAVVWCIYRLAETFFSRREARIAAVLAAVSPYFLQVSNEVRGYSLLACLTAAGSLFLLKYLRGGPLRLLIGFCLAAVAAIYTEHYGLVWFAGLLFCALFCAPPDVSKKKLWAAFGATAAAGIPSLMIIAYQARYTEGAFDLSRLSEYYRPAAALKKGLGIFWHFSGGHVYSMMSLEAVKKSLARDPIFWLNGLVTAAAAALVIGVFARAWKSCREFFVFGFATWVVPMTMLLIFYPVRLDSRYLSFAAPVYFLALARGIASVRKPASWILLAVFLAASAAADVYTIRLKTDPIHKEDYLGLTQFLSARTTAADAVVNQSMPIRFYASGRGLAVAAKLFSNPQEFEKSAGARKFPRVFYVYYRNIQSTVTERIYGEVRQEMKQLGYRPLGEPVVIGGDDGLLFVYIFGR